MDATQLNYLLAVGTIGLQLFIVACLFAFWQKENVFVKKALSVCGDYILPAAFLFALAGSALTLFYSEVVGYLPCGLCWLQRVFLYPQVVILGVAIWKKHTVVADYIIALSVFGALVAGYHYYLQMGGAALLPCPASGVSDCARRYVFEFGYITFPFMSLMSFITMGVLMYAHKLRS